ncbi:MAG TPA: hypothetical protein VK395_09115 [Gemmataceae bacterium]|nr:hypothetical protein [Gemmataceae bacterium]
MPAISGPTFSDESPDVATFLAQLENIAWFGQIGQRLPASDKSQQIFRWEDWPGPEDPSVSSMADREQALYDELMEIASQQNKEKGLEFWNEVQDTVLRAVGTAVPYDPNQDTWHAPTAAVWGAIWTAGLVGLCRLLQHPVPQDQQAQWNYFLQGHWPCAWEGDYPEGRMVVY